MTLPPARVASLSSRVCDADDEDLSHHPPSHPSHCIAGFVMAGTPLAHALPGFALRSEKTVDASVQITLDELVAVFYTKLDVNEVDVFVTASPIVLPSSSPATTTSIVYANGYRAPVGGRLKSVEVTGDLFARFKTQYEIDVSTDGDALIAPEFTDPMRSLEIVIPCTRDAWPTQYQIEGSSFCATGKIMRKSEAETACARAISEGRATTMASSDAGNVIVVRVVLPKHVQGTVSFLFDQVAALPSMGMREFALSLMPFDSLATGSCTLRDERDNQKRQRVGGVCNAHLTCIAGAVGLPVILPIDGISLKEVPSVDDTECRKTYVVGDALPAQLVIRLASPTRSVMWSTDENTLLMVPKQLVVPVSAPPNAVVIVCDISGSMGSLTVHCVEGSLLDGFAAIDHCLEASRRDVQALMVIDLARYLFARGTPVVYVCPFGTEVTVHECTSEAQVEDVVRNSQTDGSTEIVAAIKCVMQTVGEKKPTTMVVLTDDHSKAQLTAAEWDACKRETGMDKCRVRAAKFGSSPDGPIANLGDKQVKRLFTENSVKWGDVQSHLDKLRAWASDALDGMELPQVYDATEQLLEVMEHPSSPIVCIGGTGVSLPLKVVLPTGELLPLVLDDVRSDTMSNMMDSLRMSVGLMGLSRLSHEDRLDRCVKLQVLCPGLAFQTDIELPPASSTELEMALTQSTGGGGNDEPMFRSLGGGGGNDEPMFRSLGGGGGHDEPTYRSLGGGIAHRAMARPPPPQTLDPHHIVMCAIRLFADGGAADYGNVVSLLGCSPVPSCPLLQILLLMTMADAWASPSDVDDVRRARTRLKGMMAAVEHLPFVQAVKGSVERLTPSLEVRA